MNFVAILLFLTLALCEEKTFLGCFNDIPGAQVRDVSIKKDSDDCINACSEFYYRYAFLRQNKMCYCDNFLGEKFNSSTCEETCPDCALRNTLANVYECIVVPGPPKNFVVRNITDTQAYLSWYTTNIYGVVDHYLIEAKVVGTYATYKINPLKLTYSNNTYNVLLISLHPGTKYNVSVQAIGFKRPGGLVHQVITTEIGVPDHVPQLPTIISQTDSTMKISMHPVINNNGPVTSYLIVVVNIDEIQPFQPSNLKNYREALNEGMTYYIAAEIPPKDVEKEFLVGDGKSYGIYYNSKLTLGVNYKILVGMKSKVGSSIKLVFSNYTSANSDVIVLQLPNQETSSFVTISFYIGITVLSVALIAVVVGFVCFRNRVMHNRQQMNDNQELTIQGPMVDMENNGYIPEEEMALTNHKESLSSQLWNIPYDCLKVQPSQVLGHGKFGPVFNGTVQKECYTLNAAIYVIKDDKLNRDEKRCMLKDLDMLIRAGKNANILELIGISENMDTVSVALEYSKGNLKEFLLNSRNKQAGRITNMFESDVLKYAAIICKGMTHLHSKNIIHKQLCARNIALVNGNPKVSGFGLNQYSSNNLLPMYTRWTAKEIFRGQEPDKKSDVWSFACLLWEICTIGATPYGNIPNVDIPDKIMRGLRLKKLPYVEDSMFQILLNCWQLDLDERPSFIELDNNFEDMKQDMYTPYVEFKTRPDFEYETYFSELELIHKNM